MYRFRIETAFLNMA